ncbi:MAG: ABC transporter permease [Acidisphaera sp.]|nr:ABC transporter permease [Acidisphaera sp.]
MSIEQIGQDVPARIDAPAPAVARPLGAGPFGAMLASRAGLAVVQAVILAVIIAAWQAVADGMHTEFWTSSPLGVARALAKWWSSGTLTTDLRLTLFEAGCGFVAGSLAGGIVGFVLGWIRGLGDVFEPFVLSLYTLPKIALAPLFVLWFGIGPLNKVMFAGLLVFFMVFFTTFQGIRQVDRDIVANARLLGASRAQIWTKIAMPYAAVWIFTGLRIGLPYALIGAIVGEFVAADSGVGFRIKESTSYFDTAGVFAGLVVLMAVSLLFLGLLKIVERHVLRWQDPGMTVTAPDHQA